MDLPKKISKLTKDINHISKLNINNQIKELLIQEVKFLKNVKNNNVNKQKLARKKIFLN